MSIKSVPVLLPILVAPLPLKNVGIEKTRNTFVNRALSVSYLKNNVFLLLLMGWSISSDEIRFWEALVIIFTRRLIPTHSYCFRESLKSAIAIPKWGPINGFVRGFRQQKKTFSLGDF